MKNLYKMVSVMIATSCKAREAYAALAANGWNTDEAIIDIRCEQIFS